MIPESIWLDVQFRGIPGTKEITIQSNLEFSTANEIRLFDTVHLNPEMRGISDQLGYAGVELSCWRAPQVSKEFASSGLEIESGKHIYSKKFTMLDPGTYRRTTKIIHGVSGVFSIDSSSAGWVPGYDVLPYGGRVGKGLGLEDVQPFFAQIRDPGKVPRVMLTHSQFWQKRGIDPRVGGVVRGKNIHFASLQGDISMMSLEDDVRSGKIKLPIVYNAEVIGTWVSKQYAYVNRANNVISIQFIR